MKTSKERMTEEVATFIDSNLKKKDDEIKKLIAKKLGLNFHSSTIYRHKMKKINVFIGENINESASSLAIMIKNEFNRQLNVEKIKNIKKEIKGTNTPVKDVEAENISKNDIDLVKQIYSELIDKIKAQRSFEQTVYNKLHNIQQQQENINKEIRIINQNLACVNELDATITLLKEFKEHIDVFTTLTGLLKVKHMENNIESLIKREVEHQLQGQINGNRRVNRS